MTDEELMEALASIKAAILLADKNQKDVNDQARPSDTESTRAWGSFS
jgi:hypothetical protein